MEEHFCSDIYYIKFICCFASLSLNPVLRQLIAGSKLQTWLNLLMYKGLLQIRQIQGESVKIFGVEHGEAW